jgi:glycosyltransferase family protein
MKNGASLLKSEALFTKHGWGKDTMDDYKSIIEGLIEENKKLNQCQAQSEQIIMQMVDYVEQLQKELEQTQKNLKDLKGVVYMTRAHLLSLPYEMADPDYVSPVFKPHFMSASATREAVKNGKSIGRLGDGEFAVIKGEERWNFQQPSEGLGKKIKEVLLSEDENFLVGLNPTFYSNLADLHEYDAIGVRAFMVPEERKFHASLLKRDRIYADALMCELKSDTDVSEVKQIWDKKNMFIIEGRYTRMGVGNDLFDNASSIKRILAPAQNAYDKYDAIMTEAMKLPKNSLVLIALGPTATALSYDLYKEGYHAVDIGHLDLKYEQYIRKMDQIRDVHISYKYCNSDEVGELRDIPAPEDPEYNNQIISIVE